MSKSAETRIGFSLSPAGQEAFAKLLDRYPTKESCLMPTLWLIQEENGYVTPEGVDWVVEKLETSRARVFEIISFYNMFQSEPPAEYVLWVCHNISCHLMGARSIIAHLEKRLGIRLGERTPDGKFALAPAECLGACGHGPALQLGKHYYENLTNEKVDAILESLKKGIVPRADTDREVEE